MVWWGEMIAEQRGARLLDRLKRAHADQDCGVEAQGRHLVEAGRVK